MIVRRFISFLYSTKLMAILFIAFAIAMAVGTFVENDYDTDTARIWVYNTWWFEAIIGLFVVNFIGNISRYRLLKRENWAVLVLHLSWVFIIVGAGVTRYFGDEGMISLREGETTNTYLSDRTYITAMVDGNYQGALLRKKKQKEVLFSPYTSNHYQWFSDFKGKPFSITYKSFKRIGKEMNALVLEVISGNQRKEVTVMGKRGVQHPPITIDLNGLQFHLSYGAREEKLPFSLILNDFIAEKYPGTENSYASFKSKVTVNGGGETFSYDIEMNHILNYQGYRLFQSSFHPDEQGTILSVNRDFWGTLITYVGYILLFGSLLAFMFIGKSRFRKLNQQLKDLQAKRIAIVLALCFGFLATAQTPMVVPDKAHAEKFGAMLIQDDGRFKPVNTFSSELLRKLNKHDTYKGLTSDQVLLSMLLSPQAWYESDIIYVKKANDSLHRFLGVREGTKWVKPKDFFDANGQYKLAPLLKDIYNTNTPNQFQKDFKEVDQRIGLLNRALQGDIFKVFPVPNDPNYKWISHLDYVNDTLQITDPLYKQFVKNALPAYLILLQQATGTSDYSKADKVLNNIKLQQEFYSAEVLPSPAKIQTELWYNRINIFEQLFQAYLYLGTVLFIVLLWHIFIPKQIFRRLTQIGIALLWLSFILHTVGLAVRWYLSGHAPFSDAYESMIYVGWSAIGVGLFFSRRSPLTVAATAFVTAMILMIAHWNWMDPAIGTLQPVLNSYWLMLHVAMIVGSYGPFALGMLLGVINLLLMIVTTRKNAYKINLIQQELTIVNELALTVGLVMLTIGNFLGGMWANESWGRYWGWDPKETWALISIMIYALAIHLRLIPHWRGRWVFNFMSIISFGSILMTYFGVNFYLTGMHSYATGDKIITPTFVYYAVGIVLLLGLVSYLRVKNTSQVLPKSNTNS
ncbi:putative cytochrome c-type biogenesis protein CcsB [Capnocytophaga ochracea F0287]|uniref:Putative cytochrome c-type biogenesis protein CcsB n=1 Tax=Capnocytophaga ochracea F0287 TaxID=873517 RepID=E4MPQ1_CAPOC|nr:cytochrome c biogenesis protein CcsA [Capnocytophaga ochracea]EFS98271.1 putative cytochrome c-type biogenesis protein CcsB [Capnocytophaga ochracea F0287]EJF45686.1 putative cytochrome c-type biogenesis protein CcsB [Capnocytophaga ochracea str. Holt 25]UEB43399.1 cytochrome c biogenesis protein CcsA [Capnocytophaga ochracea]